MRGNFIKKYPDAYWDDLRAPAATTGTGATAPSYNEARGTYDFVYNANEYVSFQFQLPHTWIEGTPIIPHVHWCKTTAAGGNVEWRFRYRWYSIGEVRGNAVDIDAETTVSGTPDNDTAFEHLITSFGEIDTSGKTISDFLIARLQRRGSSYSGVDHYTNTAALLGFDIHHLNDGQGSKGAFKK